jgi:FkbM family methyltransferase
MPGYSERAEQRAKEVVRTVFKSMGLGVTKYDTLQKEQRDSLDLEFLLKTHRMGQSPSALDFLQLSKAQLRQDLFVLTQLAFKTQGFFVEFGATDGISLSNTYLLENEFGWSGILAEPARTWHPALRINRSAHIETNCVWSKTGQILKFNEVGESAEFSTISDFTFSDVHSRIREGGRTYDVATISLLDLLEKYDAPTTIDYLSVDTEGSEFEILKNFDFGKYSFRVITAEHNFTQNRDKLHELLLAKGYRRVFTELSGFDDWYVLNQVAKQG